jgi:hypothetical protein
MKRIALSLLIFTCFLNSVWAGELLTVAEKSDFKRTSLYPDVIEFIFAMQSRSNKIAILTLTHSVEGRMIPLVVLSKEGIRSASDLRS